MTTNSFAVSSNAADTPPALSCHTSQSATLPSWKEGNPANQWEAHITSSPTTNSTGICRELRENSGMIQVTSTVSSIWRGEEWSDITFHLKVDECFLAPSRNIVEDEGMKSRKNASISRQSPHRFELRACLERLYHDDEGNHEYYEMKGVSEYAHIDFAKSRPERDGTGDDGSMVAVTNDRYHRINVRIHRHLFSDGATFVVRVDSVPVGEDHDECDECIFGRSEPITVAEHALFVEERFSHIKSVERMEDDHGGDDSTFIWYSKSVGSESGLDVEIHLKDSSGFVTPWMLESPLRLKTELVYDDGSPCPLWPFDSKRSIAEGDCVEQQRKLLYRPLLRDDPAIRLAETSCPFSFRIEEVSYHHHGHNGFKLKVSARDGSGDAIPVHPAILGETIVVKSKQNSESRCKKRGLKAVAVASTDTAAIVPSLDEKNKKRQRRKVSEDDITPEDLEVLLANGPSGTFGEGGNSTFSDGGGADKRLGACEGFEETILRNDPDLRNLPADDGDYLKLLLEV